MSNESFSCYLMGTESLLIQCAEILVRGGHTIRGIISSERPIQHWAAAHEIPVIQLGDLTRDGAMVEPFDYFFSITNLTIVPPAVLALPTRAAINFHDGPLPRYAGLNAPVWAIMQGESRYGVTWHTMAAGVDTGEILKQQMFDVAPDETALTLNMKCFEAAIQSFTELVDELAGARAEACPQDLDSRTYFSGSKRPRAAGMLDFARPAEELDALIRALQFGPYANPLALPKLPAGGAPPVVLAAEVSGARSAAAPGTVVEAGADGIRVATASDDLILTRLATLDGTPLAPSEVIERMGLSQGQQIPPLHPEAAERLTSLAERTARHERFWVERLADLHPIDIPYADRGAARRGERYERAAMSPPADIRAALVVRRPGSAPADLLIAAFTAYLARVCGVIEFDLAYGAPSLRRDVAGAEQIFATHVPMRVRADPGAALAEALTAATAELETVRRRVTFARDAIARFPQLAHLRSSAEGQRLPVAVEIVTSLDGYQPPAGSELTFVVTEDGETCCWVFDADVFDPAAIASMQRQFLTFLRGDMADPGAAVAALPLLGTDERRRVLDEWNNTAADYPRDRCVHQLFEAQVARTPDAVALVCEDQRLTYRELNARANQLARYLTMLGVGPDVLVGVCVERSIDLVVAILAVHKAGGGYVPLDPAYPRDRIAYMLEDAAVRVLLTQQHLKADLPVGVATVLCLDTGWDVIAALPDTDLTTAVAPANLAYVIYTSGSTGKPKGVMVEHRNAVNFFTGMDERLIGDPPGSWLAVTSLSFDISVLELLWTLARGFKVVLYTGDKGMVASAAPAAIKTVGFSLFYFAADESEGGDDKYRLLLEGARFADQHGFEAVWTPERHCHAFGGLFPNPSVTSAALAAITERVKIRAGSCVLPLHSPIRIAEEWSVVDNLSKGRVGISFAAGWQPNDFVLRPENYRDAKAVMVRDIETVRRLWRGETVAFPGHDGKDVPVRILPRPVQAELPVWLTAAGNPETFRIAGEQGTGILTHLLGQSLDEVAEKVAIYRKAWAAAGHPGEGHVTLMLHTFVGEDEDSVRETVRRPMIEYLRTAAGLIKQFASTFPAFRNRAQNPGDADAAFASLSDEELDALLDHAFNRYYETSGLFGTVERCVEIIDRVKTIGVDEVGCLVDFGVDPEAVLRSLPLLGAVKEASSGRFAANDYSIPALIHRHGVTHLQCTPSMAMMLAADPQAREGLRGLRQLMIGGEGFPAALAADLTTLMSGSIVNMYGPTETTIWSSTHPVTGAPAGATVPIGRPIANTQLYILDRTLAPVPMGVPGELFIGGDGVVRGYLNRPELTAERFVPNPFVADPDARMYRTGDLARYLPDGVIEFLGRMDHQVKIRGYRIELGEIESLLNQQAGVREAVVIAREDTPGDVRLVAYAVAEPGASPAVADLRRRLAADLPEFMVPSHVVFLDAFPLTPNKKIDRKALPRPSGAPAVAAGASLAPPSNAVEETIAGVWRAVLNVPQVSTQDNFFDLGGHSLLIVQVHRRLTETLGPRLSLTDLFRFPTIRALADYLAQDAAGGGAQEQSTSRADARREAMARRRQLIGSRN